MRQLVHMFIKMEAQQLLHMITAMLNMIMFLRNITLLQNPQLNL